MEAAQEIFPVSSRRPTASVSLSKILERRSMPPLTGPSSQHRCSCAPVFFSRKKEKGRLGFTSW
eukprot:6331573-Karenia_brevis.AAC.1